LSPKIVLSILVSFT